jgi:hypothetical protein
MADLKTSQESLGSALSGTEKIRVTQGGVSVYVPASYLAALGVGFSTVTVTYGATTTVNLTSYAGIPIVILDLTLTGDVTFNLTNGEDGQMIKLRIRQDGSGGHVFTAGANLRFSDDIASIVLSTAADALDYLLFMWNGADGKADAMATNYGFPG